MSDPEKGERNPPFFKEETPSPSLQDQTSVSCNVPSGHSPHKAQLSSGGTPHLQRLPPPAASLQHGASNLNPAANSSLEDVKRKKLRLGSVSSSTPYQHPSIQHTHGYPLAPWMHSGQSLRSEVGYNHQQRLPYPPGTPLMVDDRGLLVPQYRNYATSDNLHAPPNSAFELSGYGSVMDSQQGHNGAQYVIAANGPPTYVGFGGGSLAYSPDPAPNCHIRPSIPQTPLESHPGLIQSTPLSNRKRKRENGPNAGHTREPKRPRDKDERKQLAKRPGHGDTLFFRTRDEALEGVAVPHWNAPQGDKSLPDTEAERRHWVRSLVRAFLDLSMYKDKNGPVFKKRWFDPEKPEEGYKDYYDRKAIEKMCWDIVYMVEKLHREGPKAFSCYDPAFQKMVAKTQSLTFEARVTKLIELFSKYKARCDKMFKSSVMETYIADPDTMLATAETNRDANDKRQKYITEGRGGAKNKIAEAMAQNTPTENQPCEVIDEALYSTGILYGTDTQDEHSSEGSESEDDMDDTDVEISLAERMEICDQVGDEGDADGNIQVESPEAEAAAGDHLSLKSSHVPTRKVDETYPKDDEEADIMLDSTETSNEVLKVARHGLKPTEAPQ